MKRKESEWGFGEFFKDAPSGVGGRSVQIDENTIVFHIKHPPSMSAGEQSHFFKWAKHIKDKLPENVFMLVTDRRVDLNVERPPIPKRIDVRFLDCKIQSTEDVSKKILSEFDKLQNKNDLVQLSVEFNGCTIDFDEGEK